MDVGKIGVLIGLVSSIVAVILYVLSLRGNPKTLRLARGVYAVAVVSVVFCFGRLMWLVYHHRFDFHYVFEYSDTNLRLPWNIAATWAGQEGSFLLWAFWTAIIGGLVAWKAGKWESRVMPFYISVLCFLFGILVWLSPFEPLSHFLKPGIGPNDYPLDLPWPPLDGKGLHPSLQNYWMAIHPPTIFFGFASLAVAFCYAIASLVWREYEAFATRVMPWVLMTTATLGVGLFMGGYWAYETQGWHGFWGWDPVENASLFPWLGGLALLHGLVVQKSRGGMGRTNLFLAILAWNLFLYGTFLTRSGIMADFSVHSFVSLESQPLKLLIVMMATYGLGGLALLAWRWRSIPGRPMSDRALSRDTAMVIAVTLMIAACFMVLLGTSWPILAHYIPAMQHIKGLPFDPEKKGAAVLLPLAYNKVGSMLVIPALLMMGAVPFLAWGKTNLDKFLWKVIAPWLTAVGVGAFLVWFTLAQAGKLDNSGQPFPVDTPRMLVVAIGTLGMFVALANIALAVKLLRIKAVTMGGWLAHVGIGLLFLGTVITNVYEQTEYSALVEGYKPVKTSFGYSLQFEDWTHSEKEAQMEAATDPAVRARLQDEISREWAKFDHGLRMRVFPSDEVGVVHADDGDKTWNSKEGFVATLPLFLNKMHFMNPEKSPETMRWPFIHKEWIRDFYVVPASDPKRRRPEATLRPGDEAQLMYTYQFGPNETRPVKPTGYLVTYKKFYFEGAAGQAGTKMGAELEVTTPDGKKATARPGMKLGGEGGPEKIVAQMPEIGGAVMLSAGPDPATKQVTASFEFADESLRWVIPIAITNKPGINLVWLGVILMGSGTLCAMVRRSREARKGSLIVSAAAAGMVDVPIAVEPPSKNGGDQATNGASAGSRHKPSRKAKAKASR